MLLRRVWKVAGASDMVTDSTGRMAADQMIDENYDRN